MRQYDFRNLPDEVFAEATSRKTYNNGIMDQISFPGLLNPEKNSDSDKRILVKWVRDDPDRVQDKIDEMNINRPKRGYKFGGTKKKRATRRRYRALSRR